MKPAPAAVEVASATPPDSDYEAVCQSETVSRLPVVAHSINTSSTVNPIPSLQPLTSLSILRASVPPSPPPPRLCVLYVHISSAVVDCK